MWPSWKASWNSWTRDLRGFRVPERSAHHAAPHGFRWQASCRALDHYELKSYDGLNDEDKHAVIKQIVGRTEDGARAKGAQSEGTFTNIVALICEPCRSPSRLICT